VLFPGFALDVVDVGEVRLRARVGGDPAAPAVVLLHGHPRTHATWSRVAPLLVERGGFRVVCPDLRGYGRSTLPPDRADHAQASKRAMARDVVGLMDALGAPGGRFAVVGHDRGALAAFRTAMDHPDRVSELVVMDGLPVVEHLERADWRFAADWWHWWFMGQTDKPAEAVINDNLEWWYRVAGPEAMGAEAHADLWAALRDPAVVHGMCEDYRAGLGVDREHDEADRAAGRRVRCPTLVMWSERDDMEDIYGPAEPLWRPWVEDGVPLRTTTIDAGHHVAEEAPEAVVTELVSFLKG
jgi:haloacetate dehalogenase